MQQSGCEELSRKIDKHEKFAYVKEIKAEGLAEWAKTNGFTVDELAWIQPAYPPNFVLADLGISSMQIDNPDRGFSFKIDGPLDLRLNPNSGKSAAALLKTITKAQLIEILITNADEPYAEQIAEAIIANLKNGSAIETTTQLREIIISVVQTIPNYTKTDHVKKACQRVFQALRIAINNEFGVLDKFLEKLPNALAKGGRVAILSFHSGEDRRVKKSFQYFFREGIYASISPDMIRPSVEECAANPRAKSAKLRWAIKG
jgi:16S rRNA (cytosine1402-N4)-methyltransferase